MSGSLSTYLILIGLLTLYSIIHSLFALPEIKRRCQHYFSLSSSAYRLFYNLFALVTLIPVVPILFFNNDIVIYEFSTDWYPLFLTVRILSIIGMLISVYQLGWKEFVGIPVKQQKNQQILVTHGLYSFSRHPLYLFAVIFIWSTDEMTLSWCIFACWSSLYFYIGTFIEEKRLIKEFGDAYLIYKKAVGRFVTYFPRKNYPL